MATTTTRGTNVRTIVGNTGIVRYEARWRDSTGKERSKTFATLEAALASQEQRKLDRLQGRLADESKHSQPFERYADEWMATKQTSGVRQRTLDGYADILRVHIVPHLGNKPVGRLDTAAIQQYVHKLGTIKSQRGYGLHPKSIRNIVNVVRQVFDCAIRAGAITHNPAMAVLLPGVSANPKPTPFMAHPLSAEQVQAVCVVLDANDPTGQDSFIARLFASTGVRAAELAGLEIADVNTTTWHVHIRRTKHVVGTRVKVGLPKTKRSARDIPIGSAFRPRLLAFLESHPRRDDPTAPLIPARGHGNTVDWQRPLDPNWFLQSRFRPALKKAGLPPARLHDLRHSFGTLLIAAGMPLIEVSRLLGHSNIGITDAIYVHRSSADLHHVVDALPSFG